MEINYDLPRVREINQIGHRLVLSFTKAYQLEELLDHSCKFLEEIYNNTFHPVKTTPNNVDFSERWRFENGRDRFDIRAQLYIDGVAYFFDVDPERVKCSLLQASPVEIRNGRTMDLAEWENCQKPLPKWLKKDSFKKSNQDLSQLSQAEYLH